MSKPQWVDHGSMSSAVSRLSKSINSKLTLAVVLSLQSFLVGGASDHEDAESLRQLENEVKSLRRRMNRRNDVQRIRFLKEVYSAHIFDYCLKEHGADVEDLTRCTKRQQERKDRIFARAHAQLGQQSLVQSIYDECLEYYPQHSVARIGHCVDARLELRDRLGDESVEREIYDRCDKKWGRHGAREITNCSIHAANYYRREGQLRD